MKNKTIVVLLLCSFCVFFFPHATSANSLIHAKTPIVLAASEEPAHVTDGAGILTEAYISNLNDACKNVYLTRKTHIFIITTGTIGNDTPKRYLEDYYDKYCAPHSYSATVLVLLNMDPNDRWIEIQGYGKAESRLQDDDIDDILDNIYLDLKSDDYYKALNHSIDSIEKELAPPFYLQTWFSFLLALLVAGIVVFSMAYHSGGRMTVNENTYLDEGRSKLLARHDRYIRTTLTKRRKPQNDSSSSGGGGRSGGGVSGGGHSHSGGGRSF